MARRRCRGKTRAPKDETGDQNSMLIVQQLPDGQRMMDFGHADLLTAKHAQPLVWKPVLDWIKAHRRTDLREVLADHAEGPPRRNLGRGCRWRCDSQGLPSGN